MKRPRVTVRPYNELVELFERSPNIPRTSGPVREWQKDMTRHSLFGDCMFPFTHQWRVARAAVPAEVKACFWLVAAAAFLPKRFQQRARDLARQLVQVEDDQVRLRQGAVEVAQSFEAECYWELAIRGKF